MSSCYGITILVVPGDPPLLVASVEVEQISADAVEYEGKTYCRRGHQADPTGEFPVFELKGSGEAPRPS